MSYNPKSLQQLAEEAIKKQNVSTPNLIACGILGGGGMVFAHNPRKYLHCLKLSNEQHDGYSFVFLISFHF